MAGKLSESRVRSIVWLGSTKRDLTGLPRAVVRTFGFALYLAQIGARHEQAKTLSGFGDGSVLEIVESDRAGTYRAIYTVRFEKAVFVLHVFKKKSTRGIATRRTDITLLRARLQLARDIARSMEP